MSRQSSAFLSELPSAPAYNPIDEAIRKTADPETAHALQCFANMPASTGVFANPVRYQHAVTCDGTTLDLSIRSFGLRGCLLEDDIVAGSADTLRVIFVGLFGRVENPDERRTFSRLLSSEFHRALRRRLPELAKFVKKFPDAGADVSTQYMSAVRKATEQTGGVNLSRTPAAVLRDLIRTHLENCVAAAGSSYMRFVSRSRTHSSPGMLLRETERFLESIAEKNPFHIIFSLLLHRKVHPAEARILQTFGTIQIHHGSAGSNMVARYLASLHTKSVSDLFTAAQMTLDCARHFGAITGMTELVAELEHASPSRRDELIRQRAVQGNLPAFGHPEIAAAGRTNRLELDPRPAIYLAPLFDAIDSGSMYVPEHRMKRVEIVQRIYQLAFVEGIEKPGRAGVLRVTPNTDFGAWIVQEVLGIEESDRTLLSYVFRGFGWMMDVREQLQQPIIRPVIPPDPAIVPPPASSGELPNIVDAVHLRLSNNGAFVAAATPN